VKTALNPMPTKLANEIITAAIEGFESQKAQIDAQIAELRQMLTGRPAETAAAPEPAKRKRRKMSAAGRARIAEAQRKRWAEYAEDRAHPERRSTDGRRSERQVQFYSEGTVRVVKWPAGGTSEKLSLSVIQKDVPELTCKFRGERRGHHAELGTGQGSVEQERRLDSVSR
jgi:hypothetical protein